MSLNRPRAKIPFAFFNLNASVDDVNIYPIRQVHQKYIHHDLSNTRHNYLPR